MDRKRTRLWQAACRRRRLQIDIERRDHAPTELACHGEMVAREPQPLAWAFRRREQSRPFGKAEVAGHRNRLTRHHWLDGSMLDALPLHRVWDKAGIDHDHFAAAEPRR